MIRQSLVVFVSVLLVGTTVRCAPASVTAHGASSNVITADEIVKSEATNAYEVIQKLRPTLLATRGPTNLYDASSGAPTVYLDDVRYGDLSTLRSITATDIAMIRAYNAGEATYKFGTGNMGGVIAVYTKH